MSSPSSAQAQREHNAIAHDRVAHTYDEKHSEIYNAIEQARLEATIDELIHLTPVSSPDVLDFGAGTGNLSLKFAARNCRVTAADVSARSLERLRARVRPGSNRQLEVSLLTDDRIPFADASFDIVATYSVLHHVPDYLNAVKEMARVLRPGGLLYIDHESNDQAWEPNENLRAYRKLTKLTLSVHVRQLIRTGELFTADFAKTAFMKLFVNRRYEREGDLHVWPDDHIEWDKIVDSLRAHHVSLIRSRDYLLYRPRGSLATYQYYSTLCSDTRYIFARKD